MVERFNRSLLQLLRCYTQQENDWEQYLPLVLYAYCTAPHSATGISPFELMFGRTPRSSQVQSLTGFDPSSYSAQLQIKLRELQELVLSNTSTAAQAQKFYYDRTATNRSFTPQELVWLSIPTAGKLQPRWEGKWKVVEMKGPVTVEITDGRRTKVVHINRVRHRDQPFETPEYTSNYPQPGLWQPGQTEHYIQHEAQTVNRRYPQRQRNPPDWYRP